MFDPADSWVWDFWIVDDGRRYHLFFLYASRALHDPEARHHRASVGHAVSDDLTGWERVADALVRSDAPAFDDLATWTGSVVRHRDGTWFMFYTGATAVPDGNVQTVGYATSSDLMSWHKAPGPVARADPRWYETIAERTWREEAFRDPWVVADPDGAGWHMLVTGRANHGPVDERGVIAHAWSPDLRNWQVREPLTTPGQGFGQLEVLQPVRLGGRDWIVFNCDTADLAQNRKARGETGGIWIAPAAGPLGPYRLAEARLLADPSLYVGKVVVRRDTGEPQFLAFRNRGPTGQFVGGITDPVEVALVDGWPVVPRPGGR